MLNFLRMQVTHTLTSNQEIAEIHFTELDLTISFGILIPFYTKKIFSQFNKHSNDQGFFLKILTLSTTF